MEQSQQINIIGAGLAGSEAALQLAKRGFKVTIYDLKPKQRSEAHHRKEYAEIVCSNSLGNLQTSTASGLLKAEMEILDCELLRIAKAKAVPAGNALAVDREAFSDAVTEALQKNPNITCISQDITQIPNPDDITLIATGPLTSPGLSETLQTLFNQSHLYFFDAAAPIVTTESINMNIAFAQDRYNNSAENTDELGHYINCPLDEAQYKALLEFVLSAECVAKKAFEDKESFFESCLPIEELCRRGFETPRFGPMKPVGLTNPHKQNEQPYAVVQLRQDNTQGTLFNLVGFQTSLKWGDQKTMIQLIPGLEEADIVRYGVMHRNTYINSPAVLSKTLQLNEHPNIFMAGQLTGVEGYTECIATGIIAAENIARAVQNQPKIIPSEKTMLGALLRYITRSEAKKHFQPINSNWGILPMVLHDENGKKIRDKKLRRVAMATIAIAETENFNQHRNNIRTEVLSI